MHICYHSYSVALNCGMYPAHSCNNVYWMCLCLSWGATGESFSFIAGRPPGRRSIQLWRAGKLLVLLYTVYHESFEAKNLRGQCITQIFMKKLSQIPIVIAISARFSIATEIFSWKKVLRSTKKSRNFSTSKLSWYTVSPQVGVIKI